MAKSERDALVGRQKGLMVADHQAVGVMQFGCAGGAAVAAAGSTSVRRRPSSAVASRESGVVVTPVLRLPVVMMMPLCTPATVLLVMMMFALVAAAAVCADALKPRPALDLVRSGVEEVATRTGDLQQFLLQQSLFRSLAVTSPSTRRG